jgi:DNA-binding HxlR family transcriptional regulator
MTDTVVAFDARAAAAMFGGEQQTTTRCPVDLCVEAIGGKWKPTILYHLAFGPTRFNVLRRLIPTVTARMLTLQLRELEADGIVSRTVASQVPPRVDYALTPEGETLLPILKAMAAWGERRQEAASAAA